MPLAILLSIFSSPSMIIEYIRFFFISASPSPQLFISKLYLQWAIIITYIKIIYSWFLFKYLLPVLNSVASRLLSIFICFQKEWEQKKSTRIQKRQCWKDRSTRSFNCGMQCYCQNWSNSPSLWRTCQRIWIPKNYCI